MNATTRIQQANLRATLPRIALIEFLEKQKRPVSVQHIVRELGQAMDAVTVYRALDVFCKVRLVREVDLRQGKTLYEVADAHDHHHVVCIKCNRIEDFEGCEYEKIAHKALKQVKGFAAIDSHSLELFGVCTACAK